MPDVRKCLDPYSPDRCQAIIHDGNKQGQCQNLSEVGSQRCGVHASNVNTDISEVKTAVRNYRVTKWREKLEKLLADPESVLCLREEIGILRILIQERIGICNDVHDIMMNSNVIGDMVSRVERVVVSCEKIEERRGSLLDKSKTIQLATEIVSTISKHITDEDTLVKIAEEIGQIIIRISEQPNLDKKK